MKLLIVLLLIISSFISLGQVGCQTNLDVDVNEIKNVEDCKALGNDYITVPGRICCLDENSNDKCDDQEAQAPCDDECSKPLCLGDNKKIFYDCVKKVDGCKNLEPKGMIINECNVECFSKTDCRSDERCFNHKCEKDKCGDGVQGTYENCEICPEDFLKDGQICCDKKVIQGNCCGNLGCEENQECTNNLCTAKLFCGDGICSPSESCSSCSEDCLNEGEFCCGDINITGNCCGDSDCELGIECKNNVCTQPPIQEQANQTEIDGTNQSS